MSETYYSVTNPTHTHRDTVFIRVARAPLASIPHLMPWKLGGLIYSEAADPRVWVPKRVGYGWTLNFAHTESWIWLGALGAFLGATCLRIRFQKA